MVKINEKYSVAMKTSFSSNELSPIFQNTLSFARTLTEFVTVFTNKTLIFSTTVG